MRYGLGETAAVLEQQIAAMESQRYEIGIYRRNANEGKGAMLIRDWGADALQHAMRWLQFENGRGADIYIRPAGSPHNLTLVDDLSADALLLMKETGFQPAVVVETSPRNFQAWLKHGERLDKQTSTAVARALAERFGGDRGAADWRHFGRLAGWRNRKACHLDVLTGRYPLVRLVEASGCVYAESGCFLVSIKLKLEELRQQRERSLQQFGACRGPWTAGLKSIADFRADPRYEGDGKRCDLAYALYAFARGADAAQVEAAIRSRDLSHRGSERRQDDYVQRTLHKAMEAAGRGR